MAVPRACVQALLPNWDTLSTIQSPHPGHVPHIDFVFRAMATAVCKVLSRTSQAEMQTPGSREGADRNQLRLNGKVWGSLLRPRFLFIGLGCQADYQGLAPLDPGSWPPTGSQHLPVFTFPDP